MSDMDVGGLSLDEVIKQKRIGRNTNRRSGGGGRQRRDGGIQKPSSPKRNPKKWDNDKFFETTRAAGGAPRRLSGAGAGGKAVARLSNIPFSVSQEDLDDLFAEYRLSRISLHYDFRGKSLGTGELHGPHGVLSRLARDFANVEIDGRSLHISVVGEGASPSLGSRVRRVGGGGRTGAGPLRNRRSSGAGGRSPGGRGGGDKRKKMTADELDKELDAYMSGNKKE